MTKRPNLFDSEMLRVIEEAKEDIWRSQDLDNESTVADRWRVEPADKTSRFPGDWVLLREDGELIATCRNSEVACLLAAILPSTGRLRVYIHDSGRVRTPSGLDLVPKFTLEANVWDEPIPEILHGAFCIAADPESLAWLLMAVPHEALERAGHRVIQRLKEAEGWCQG